MPTLKQLIAQYGQPVFEWLHPETREPVMVWRHKDGGYISTPVEYCGLTHVVDTMLAHIEYLNDLMATQKRWAEDDKKALKQEISDLKTRGVRVIEINPPTPA